MKYILLIMLLCFGAGCEAQIPTWFKRKTKTKIAQDETLRATGTIKTPKGKAAKAQLGTTTLALPADSVVQFEYISEKDTRISISLEEVYEKIVQNGWLIGFGALGIFIGILVAVKVDRWAGAGIFAGGMCCIGMAFYPWIAGLAAIACIGGALYLLWKKLALSLKENKQNRQAIGQLKAGDKTLWEQAKGLFESAQDQDVKDEIKKNK